MIIYVLPPEDEESVFLMECDKQLATELVQTMNRYKIRKKVPIKSSIHFTRRIIIPDRVTSYVIS